MAERSGYFLPGLVKGLLAAIAAMTIALSAAQAQSTCTADSNCWRRRGMRVRPLSASEV